MWTPLLLAGQTKCHEPPLECANLPEANARAQSRKATGMVGELAESSNRALTPPRSVLRLRSNLRCTRGLASRRGARARRHSVCAAVWRNESETQRLASADGP